MVSETSARSRVEQHVEVLGKRILRDLDAGRSERYTEDINDIMLVCWGDDVERVDIEALLGSYLREKATSKQTISLRSGPLHKLMVVGSKS